MVEAFSMAGMPIQDMIKFLELSGLKLTKRQLWDSIQTDKTLKELYIHARARTKAHVAAKIISKALEGNERMLELLANSPQWLNWGAEQAKQQSGPDLSTYTFEQLFELKWGRKPGEPIPITSLPAEGVGIEVEFEEITNKKTDETRGTE